MLSNLMQNPLQAAAKFKTMWDKLPPDHFSELDEVYKLAEDNPKHLREASKQPGYIIDVKRDNEQLKLAIRICKTLHRFHTATTRINLIKKFNETETYMYEAMILQKYRFLLTTVCAIFIHLSAGMKEKYRKHIKPESLRWETFEKLAWILNEKAENFTIGSVFMVENPDEKEVFERFFKEWQSSEGVLEVAIYYIIENELLKLGKFAEIIQKDAVGRLSAKENIPDFDFPAINALTNRIMEVEALNDLLKLTFDFKKNEISKTHPSSIREQNNFANINPSPALIIAYPSPAIDTLTNLQKHEILRRLQRVGELITGKNLLPLLSKLDQTTDWQALITLRNGITHQDQGGNKAIVAELLNDPSAMLTIANEELLALCRRVCKVIVARDKEPPVFNEKDSNAFWKEIYKFELLKTDAVKTSNNRPSKELFTGFDTLYGFAKKIKKSPICLLEKTDFIRASFDAINNIFEFIDNEKTVARTQTLCELLALPANHRICLLQNLINAFSQNATLQSAVEYNLGQLLQSIQKLIEYTEIKSISPELVKWHEKTRTLRNYIEHGNFFIEIGTFKDYSEENKSPKKRILAQFCLLHILECLPELEKIRAILSTQQPAPVPSAVITSTP